MRGALVMSLVLMVGALTSLVLAFLLFQAKLKADVRRNEVEKTEVSNVTEQMRVLLTAVRQCTCNLRDLKVADASAGKVLDLNLSGQRGRFGYYNIDASMKCPNWGDIDDSNVVLQVADTEAIPAKALKANRFVLDSFKPDGDSYIDAETSETIQRYTARFKFSTTSNMQLARSNIYDPDLNVNIEIRKDGTIRNCYLPGSSVPTKPLSKCQQLAVANPSCDFNDPVTGAPIDFFNSTPPSDNSQAGAPLTGAQKAWIWTAHCLARKVPFTSEKNTTWSYGGPLTATPKPAIQNKAGGYMIPFIQNFANGSARIKINGHDCTVNDFYNSDAITNYHSDWFLNITCDGTSKSFHWLSGHMSLMQNNTTCNVCDQNYRNQSQVLGDPQDPATAATRCGQAASGGAANCSLNPANGEPFCQ